MTIMEALRRGEAQLGAKGVEDPRFNADLMLGAVLALARDRLYLERERALGPEEERRFSDLLSRRGAGEPLQYILGSQEFMGLNFCVDRRVLIPRPETECLAVQFLAAVPAAETVKVLDLCTGSGVLALTAAVYRPGARVTGTDLSADALAVARLNARRLQASVDWRQGDFLDPVRGESWDWILCNPPYVTFREYEATAPEIRFEPKEALVGGEDGLDFYRRLASEVRAFLKPGGRLLLEIGWQQAAAVCALLNQRGLKTEVFRDLARKDRVILAR
ncbi:protein-(glutamine-N5) methyltransferase, release factor-specific [Acididesulfobacillus acetoxydans]|uniref:Release factor glutamine methyltransferase n=1 Tax=Acididesulfobacillus acetoxydans TaxID=1561005 RepID=A0A8S0Y1P0_9FIRM|nr:peptide chain release factor N(5)-glutamine methyltransferase [Acididesulfobacillus acetoxydans]CAA7599745.1 protein-(glutamine-N5) methyltransferase, release factor-specific [Acididesulfobacillus acetoxydans]CEJ06296.1 Release factor glutamine methyltransferase [Acididesulfobacillus acetoxydans]